MAFSEPYTSSCASNARTFSIEEEPVNRHGERRRISLGEAGDEAGGELVGAGGAVDLPLVVAPPAAGGAVGEEDACVRLARVELDGGGDGGQRDRRGAVGDRVVADLAVVVAAPALEAAAGQARARVGGAR